MEYRDLMLLGVGLYWGEGQKNGSSLSVSNTDPRMLKFVLNWLEKCFGINRREKKIRIYNHFYSDMDIEKEIEFWQEQLGVERWQFARPYIKESKYSGVKFWSFGHGTCRIQLADAKIKRKVMALVQIFSDLSSTFNTLNGPVVQR